MNELKMNAGMTSFHKSEDLATGSSQTTRTYSNLQQRHAEGMEVENFCVEELPGLYQLLTEMILADSTDWPVVPEVQHQGGRSLSNDMVSPNTSNYDVLLFSEVSHVIGDTMYDENVQHPTEFGSHSFGEVAFMTGVGYLSSDDLLSNVLAASPVTLNYHGIDNGITTLEDPDDMHQASTFLSSIDTLVSRQDRSHRDIPEGPTANDVCFGLMKHPGTENWRATVQVHSHMKWSREVYQEVRNTLASCRFWVCRDSQWYLATEDEIFDKTQQRFKDAKKPKSDRKVGRPPQRQDSNGGNSLPWTNIVNVVTTFLEHEIMSCQQLFHSATENQESLQHLQSKMSHLQLAKEVIAFLNSTRMHH